MIDVDSLRFDERGLIPAIVVDTQTKRVLTLAYMNRESLAISMEKGLTCFYSRSRQTLWLKGETSGNYQHIVSITADCDRDALVVEVRKDGPACHLGTDSCFEYPVYEGEEPPAFSYEGLMEMSQKMVGETVQVLLVFPNLLAFLYRRWIKQKDSSTQELEECLNGNICDLEKTYTAVNETAGIKEGNAA